MAGSIVGKTYGVFRDDRVTLKSCNVWPDDRTSGAILEACMILVEEDLSTAQRSNSNVRAVINLSSSYRLVDCNADTDPDFIAGHIDESM